MFTVVCFFAHVEDQLNLGRDYSYLITPNNVIVGNLHGKQQVVCQGTSSNTKECYPNGQYNFKKGDIIDYTWGMSSDQEGSLLYGIIPS